MKIYLLRKIETHFKANCSLYAVIAALLFLGLLFGLAAPVTMGEASASAVKGYIGNYLQTLPSGDFNKNAELARIFVFNGSLALLIWLFGLHLFGIAGIAAIVVYKGFSLGYAIGFLLNYQGLVGASVIFLGILPQNILFVILLAYLSVVGVRQSLRLWGWQDFPQATLEKLLIYGKAFMRSVGVLLLGAAIQGYLCPIFLRLLYVIL